jgi:hypothetical protein
MERWRVFVGELRLERQALVFVTSHEEEMAENSDSRETLQGAVAN